MQGGFEYGIIVEAIIVEATALLVMILPLLAKSPTNRLTLMPLITDWKKIQ